MRRVLESLFWRLASLCAQTPTWGSDEGIRWRDTGLAIGTVAIRRDDVLNRTKDEIDRVLALKGRQMGVSLRCFLQDHGDYPRDLERRDGGGDDGPEHDGDGAVGDHPHGGELIAGDVLLGPSVVGVEAVDDREHALVDAGDDGVEGLVGGHGIGGDA